MRGCNQVDLATSRPATVTWMAGLSLNTVPPIQRIYTKGAPKQKYVAWKGDVDTRRKGAKPLITSATRADASVDTNALRSDLVSHLHQL